MKNKKNGIGKFLVGLGVGAGLGMLLAPKSGEALRKDLKNKFDEFVSEAKNIDLNEAKEDFLEKVESLKKEIEDLDKEKVASIAKEKGEAIKQKANELIEFAKEKGTPVLEGIANDIRNKAINVTKEVLKKLED